MVSQARLSPRESLARETITDDRSVEAKRSRIEWFSSFPHSIFAYTMSITKQLSTMMFGSIINKANTGGGRRGPAEVHH